MLHAPSAEAWRRVLQVPRRRWLIGAGVAAGVLACGTLAFGPIARSRIEREAERRHLDVTVGSVRPGFFAVDRLHPRMRGALSTVRQIPS